MVLLSLQFVLTVPMKISLTCQSQPTRQCRYQALLANAYSNNIIASNLLALVLYSLVSIENEKKGLVNHGNRVNSCQRESFRGSEAAAFLTSARSYDLKRSLSLSSMPRENVTKLCCSAHWWGFLDTLPRILLTLTAWHHADFFRNASI